VFTGVFICAMLAVLLGGLAAAGILDEPDVVLALGLMVVGIVTDYGLGRWGRP
jgi:hypothetical protein